MKNTMFQPILSATAHLDQLTDADMPVVATWKVDGVRCSIHPELGVVTRTLKPIPNRYVMSKLSQLPHYMDGEIITRTDGEMDDFNTVQSKVMRQDGEPDFEFHVFDYFERPGDPYWQRLKSLEPVRQRANSLNVVPVRAVPTTVCNTVAHLKETFDFHVGEGWEGTMIRRVDGVYKFGRATLKEGLLSKLKVMEDSEGVVVGYKEKYTNTNVAKKDERGYAKRSSAKAGKVPAGVLGSFIVKWRGVTFSLGTGLSDEQRAHLWSIRETLDGQIVTFRFQGVGRHGRPRIPSFKGFRHPDDIG